MMELTLLQARVIGVLIEKAITTPDQYPLSLNALTVACNQKSNREPVLSLEQAEVQNIVDELSQKNLVSQVLFGNRVAKYKHRFCNTEFSELHFDPEELGVLCVLLLRGPQTPGELRTRTNRLCAFRDVQDVETTLARLMSADDGPFIAKLEREPGKRESRFAHVFCGEYPLDSTAYGRESGAPANNEEGPDTLETRVLDLEQEVASLREELDELKQAWQDFNS